jgi:hypothetical protein
MIATLLLWALAQMPTSPPAPATPAAPPLISCNIAVAMFAPGSDVLDAKAIHALDSIPAEARSALAVEGVTLMVLPHPVMLAPADEARQRSLAEGRGQRIKAYLTAHGMPAGRIGVRPAAVEPNTTDNWGEGALLMLEVVPEAWDRTSLSAIC